MMSIRRGFSLGATVAALAISTVLAPATAVEAGEGEDLAANGLRLRREGRDQEALPLFERVLRDHPSPRAYAQLGFCEQALGLWVPAEEHLQQALQSTRDSWIQKNQMALREALAFVQGRIGSVEVWGNPAGAEVRIDGQVVGRLPLARALRVAQGRRLLEIVGEGYLPHTRSIDVNAGSRSREHVALLEAPKAKISPLEAAVVPRADPPRSEEVAEPSPPQVRVRSAAVGVDDHLPVWRRVLPWSLLGAAVVAGSIGVWQHVASNDSLDHFESIAACGENATTRGADSRCAIFYDRFSSQRTRAFVGYGLGALLGAGAATLLIINVNTDSGPRGAQARISGGPGDAGLSFFVSF